MLVIHLMLVQAVDKIFCYTYKILQEATMPVSLWIPHRDFRPVRLLGPICMAIHNVPVNLIPPRF